MTNCNPHLWEQQSTLTRICKECGGVETDLEPSRHWITVKQAIQLGFRHRCEKLGLLKYTTKFENILDASI